ncbi:MAG: hypothetical protein IJ087_17860 [Eggerthellaceae bacterium]|nr:hypothetical protein [Eggerthellaceae bacterium]
MSKYGHVKYVDTRDYGDAFVEFTASFLVRRDIALDFMDALISHCDKAKRDPIGAILVYSDSMEDDA